MLKNDPLLTDDLGLGMRGGISSVYGICPSWKFTGCLRLQRC